MTRRRLSTSSERDLTLRDVRLHVTEAGDGPPVVLLHGFPETAYTWRDQLPALAAAGFHAVAPDQRGCGRSSRPAGVAAYRAGELVADVVALIDTLGGRAAVVGHDWGGAVAWTVAAQAPERVSRLAIINAPHPQRFAAGLLPTQWLRSWYMLFFQLPGLPERALSRGGHASLRSMFGREPRPPYGADEIDRQIAELGDLTTAVHWYRALFRDAISGRLPPPRRIDLPVLVLWGRHDRYLGEHLATPDPAWVPDRRVVLLEATHWVQHDAREQVNEELIRFLAG